MTILSLDLGTTTITGLLLGGPGATILRAARRRNDAALETDKPLRAEQDPRRLRVLALEVLAELAAWAAPERGGPLQGLALTGQMHSLLCVDAAGEPLSPLITWQDRRTAEPLAEVSPATAGEPAAGSTAMDRLQARVAGLDWQANGCRIRHGYGAATLFWLVAHGALPAGIHRAGTIAGWLAGHLTGQPPVTDPTFAASWGVYDLLHSRWNAAFLDRMGLDGGLLPAVRPSAKAIGGLLHLGSVLGSGALSEPASLAQAVLVNLGTGGQVCWAVPSFEPPDKAVETRPLPLEPAGAAAGQGFLRVGASLCGGAAYAWLNRTVRAWLAEFGREPGEDEVYARLNALAAACSDTHGLRVRTTFLGTRGDPAEIEGGAIEGGAIEGITLDTMSLGAVARATLAGIIDEVYGLYAAHGGPQAGAQHVVAAGGAVEHNPLLVDLIEQRFGLPVRPAPVPEAAAVGVALLARGPHL